MEMSHKPSLMMENNFSIASWNLCLGLSNKKDLVTDYLSKNNINACCVQETEIPINYPEEILDCNNYILELELNEVKKRSGIYITCHSVVCLLKD